MPKQRNFKMQWLVALELIPAVDAAKPRASRSPFKGVGRQGVGLRMSTKFQFFPSSTSTISLSTSTSTKKPSLDPLKLLKDEDE